MMSSMMSTSAGVYLGQELLSVFLGYAELEHSRVAAFIELSIVNLVGR